MSETDKTKIPGLTGKGFASGLEHDMFMSGMNLRGSSEAPWETLSYYVIELESRIRELENNLEKYVSNASPSRK